MDREPPLDREGRTTGTSLLACRSPATRPPLRWSPRTTRWCQKVLMRWLSRSVRTWRARCTDGIRTPVCSPANLQHFQIARLRAHPVCLGRFVGAPITKQIGEFETLLSTVRAEVLPHLFGGKGFSWPLRSDLTTVACVPDQTEIGRGEISFEMILPFIFSATRRS